MGCYKLWCSGYFYYRRIVVFSLFLIIFVSYYALMRSMSCAYIPNISKLMSI